MNNAPHGGAISAPADHVRAGIEFQMPGDFTLNPPPAVAPAVDLIDTLLLRGLSKSDIAKRISVHPAQVGRILKGEQKASDETHRKLAALAADVEAQGDTLADPMPEPPPRCDKTADLFSDPTPDASNPSRATDSTIVESPETPAEISVSNEIPPAGEFSPNRADSAEVASACAACGTSFKPPHKYPNAPLCADCHAKRKQALADLPRTARGHWREILPALGIGAEHLTDDHGPCPGCGGADRFRFDDREGRGTWICGGGGEQQAGDGFKLLEHVRGWSTRDAYLAVAEYFGIATPDAPIRTVSPEEREARQRAHDEQAAKDAAEVERQQAETARHAARIWESATSADGHPYLRRKGVEPTETLRQIDVEAAAQILGYRPKADGARLTGSLLVAPIIRDGQMSSLELIDGDGRKAALKGKGTKAGGFWLAQPLPDGDGEGAIILVAEGVATALSARAATGYYAVAVLSVSNFSKTISRVRAPSCKKARTILLADLDKTTGQPIAAATTTASRYRPAIPLVAPDFGTDRPAGASDFNDLHRVHGLEAVREQIEEALRQTPAAPKREPGADAAPPALSSHAGIVAPFGWKLTREWVKQERDEGEALNICGPLWVVGRTTGTHGDWGLVLAFLDHDGREQRLAIPSERLHADPAALVQDLARMGLTIKPSRRKKVLDYIADWKPDTRILSAKRLGWIEDKAGALAFVMPDRVITRDGSGQVVFQPDRYSPTVRTVHPSGSLADWQKHVAGPACQHPLMRFALCAGLAPAMLSFAEAGDSFTIHFWGTTSRGKTTLGQVAASPWGCAADPNDAPSLAFVRRWNLTANGLEGLAESHSDLPLVLDELGSSTVGDIRPLVYQLAGGQGKTALNSAREMKEPRSWRTIAISTGEMSIHARMADPTGDGTQAKTIKGGLTHRALDVEIDDIASGLPVEQRGAAVTAIKTACAQHYGTAGPELIRQLAARFASHAEARAYVRERIAAILPSLAPVGLPAETERAVRRFAMIAVAGEFAAQTGLIPATTKQVIAAVKAIVGKWLSVSAETDDQRIIANVRAFILKHEARFQPISSAEPVPNRAGYIDRASGRWLFTDAALTEAAPGHDRTTIARTLRKHGYLFTNEHGKLRARMSVGTDRPWLFAIYASIIGEESEQLSKTPGQPGQPGQSGQPCGLEPIPVDCGAPGQPGQDTGTGTLGQAVPVATVPPVPVRTDNRDSISGQQQSGFVPAVPAVPAKNGDTGKNPEANDGTACAQDDAEVF